MDSAERPGIASRQELVGAPLRPASYRGGWINPLQRTYRNRLPEQRSANLRWRWLTDRASAAAASPLGHKPTSLDLSVVSCMRLLGSSSRVYVPAVSNVSSTYRVTSTD